MMQKIGLRCLDTNNSTCLDTATFWNIRRWNDKKIQYFRSSPVRDSERLRAWCWNTQPFGASSRDVSCNSFCAKPHFLCFLLPSLPTLKLQLLSRPRHPRIPAAMNLIYSSSPPLSRPPNPSIINPHYHTHHARGRNGESDIWQPQEQKRAGDWNPKLLRSDNVTMLLVRKDTRCVWNCSRFKLLWVF